MPHHRSPAGRGASSSASGLTRHHRPRVSRPDELAHFAGGEDPQEVAAAASRLAHALVTGGRAEEDPAVVGRWREAYDDLDHERADELLASLAIDGLADRTFGPLGARAAKLVIAVSLIGWFGVNIGVLGTTGARALSEISGYPIAALAVGLPVCVLIAAITGAAL